MSAPHLELRTLPLHQLQPAPYNPRTVLKPSSPAYRKLRQSLERFGLVEPLIWNERTGHIVGGHARLRILQDLGHDAVPVSVVNLSDTEERALNVLLNNLEAQGRYDTAKLVTVLEELKSLEALESSGFDECSLRALQVEPLEDLLPLEERDRVEVILVTNAETYSHFAEALDELVRDFQLETHIKRG
jgi:ParB-like chromosome segregation protein Spo0J